MASARIINAAALRSLPLAAAAAFGGVVHLTQTSSCDAAAAPAPKPKPKPKPKVFKEATCIKSEQHTWNTRLVTLKLPADWNADRTPVANVLVKIPPVEGEPKPVIRPYNPLSAKSGDEITLLVKRYGQDAKMGSALHELAVGESIQVKGPNMQWSLPDAGAVERYSFVAGGTGVTPCIQAAEGILRKDLEARVDVITFNDTPHDVLLRERLMEMIGLYGDRLRVKNFWLELNEGMAEDDTMPDLLVQTLKNCTANPSKEILERMLPKATDCDGHVMVLVCGPKEMVAKVAGPKTEDYKQGELGGILKEMGFDRLQVWKF